MQEEVQEKTVALVIKVGNTGVKLTADLLKWAMRQYLGKTGNTHIRHGKQTVKQLVRQGEGVQNIEITEKNIKSFERVARKYGVDFAVKKDTNAGKYLVFFKAKDVDTITAAFSEYANRTMRHKAKGKPSLLAQLSKFKEAVKNQARAITQHLNKGGHEL